MKTTPNTVLYAVAGIVAALMLALALLGASALGKRRERRAWLTDRIQADWDHHADTALAAVRSNEAAEGIAALTASGYRAWNLRTARKDTP